MSFHVNLGEGILEIGIITHPFLAPLLRIFVLAYEKFGPGLACLLGGC